MGMRAETLTCVSVKGQTITTRGYLGDSIVRYPVRHPLPEIVSFWECECDPVGDDSSRFVCDDLSCACRSVPNCPRGVLSSLRDGDFVMHLPYEVSIGKTLISYHTGDGGGLRKWVLLTSPHDEALAVLAGGGMVADLRISSTE